MKKVINFIKENCKLIVAFIIGLLVSGTSAYAATMLYSANEIGYNTSKSKLTKTNVLEALDELYTKCSLPVTSCPSGYRCDRKPVTITYNANGGTFTNNVGINTISYIVADVPIGIKYSHTSNVDDTGKQNSNYGNNWTNANITGTDRGDTSKAHVVTIPGATSLTVDIYYNGQSTNYDWACVWKGSHPTYTAASCTSTDYVSGKLGGSQSGSYTVNGNSLTNMGHQTYTIEGDTVTFGFKSNLLEAGKGYGYYAIIKGEVEVITPSAAYEEPTRSGYRFKGWYTDTNYTTEFKLDSNNIPKDLSTNKTVYAKWSVAAPICKRVTSTSSLHKETCSQNYNYCKSDGYSSGATITYGNAKANGQPLATGDAFDCDVNGDGTYNSTNERFYYVSDYYDTSTKSFNNNYAVLIYYTNTLNGSASTSGAMYNNSSYPTGGPIVAAQHLPTTWDNIRLYKTNRQILNELGGITSSNVNNLGEYDYSGHQARLLTYQEANAGCYDGSTATTSSRGISSKCKFLLENTRYATDDSNLTAGPWLESAWSNNRYVYYAYSPLRYLSGYYPNSGSDQGVRPTIEVLKTDLYY